jgi:hypothetical protein
VTAAGWRFLVPAFAVALILGLRLVVIYQGNACQAAGGSLEPALSSRTGFECVRAGVVVHP